MKSRKRLRYEKIKVEKILDINKTEQAVQSQRLRNLC